MGTNVELRAAEHDDYEDVVSFTEETWPDRDVSDYLPEVYHEWVDAEDARTLVADAGEGIAGIAQCVLLSDHEAWCQGMRVDPAFRGEGIGRRIVDGLFDWAADRGATVARNMVFSWNAAGLGQSRATGFEPVTEFRWARPEPDATASPDLAIVDDPDVAWRAWADSAACDHLAGLALDDDAAWALSELTRDDLYRIADDSGVFAVVDDGARAMAYRSREFERDRPDGGAERGVEYGVGAWDDLAAARSLFAAIAADAATLGADETQVLIPETVRHVSDAAATRTPVAEEPDFVLAADLTGR